MKMDWRSLLREAAAVSVERDAAVYESGAKDACAFVDLKRDQIIDLSRKILLLPHHGIALLLGRYCYRLSLAEAEAFFQIRNAMGLFCYYRDILSSSMGLRENAVISDASFGRACQIVLEEYLRSSIGEDIARKSSRKSRSWMKWGVLAACLCLVIAIVFNPLPYTGWRKHQADDPNWSLTHYQTDELNEIEAICGTELLLDKIALPGEYHSEYILEIAEDGNFDNSEHWNSLSVQISYGDSAIDSTADNIYCFISFDGDTGAVNETLWESDATMELNGYSVQYSEKTTEDYAEEAEGIIFDSDIRELDYHGYAVFAHGGYTYYLATNSDDPDFYDSVINQMLAE